MPIINPNQEDFEDIADELRRIVGDNHERITISDMGVYYKIALRSLQERDLPPPTEVPPYK